MCQVDESSIDQLQGLMKDQTVEPNLVLLQKILCWPKGKINYLKIIIKSLNLKRRSNFYIDQRFCTLKVFGKVFLKFLNEVLVLFPQK